MQEYTAKINCLSCEKTGQSTLIQKLSQLLMSISLQLYSIQIQFEEDESNFSSLATMSVYNITTIQTFQESSKLLLQAATPIKILVGSFRDQQQQREVFFTHVNQLKAKLPNLIWFEVDLTQDDQNINILFDQIKISIQFNVLELISNGIQNNQLDNKEDQKQQNDFFSEELFVNNIIEPFNGLIVNTVQDTFKMDNFEEVEEQFQLFLKNINPSLQNNQIQKYINEIKASQEQHLKIKAIEQNLIIQQEKLVKQQDITKEKELELEKYYEQALEVIQLKSSQIIKRDQEIAQLKQQHKLLKSEKTHIGAFEGQTDFNFSGISDIDLQNKELNNNSQILVNIQDKQSVQLLSEQTVEILKPTKIIISPSISKETIYQEAVSQTQQDNVIFSPTKHQSKILSQLQKNQIVKVKNIQKSSVLSSKLTHQDVKYENNNIKIVNTKSIDLNEIQTNFQLSQGSKIDPKIKSPNIVKKSESVSALFQLSSSGDTHHKIVQIIFNKQKYQFVYTNSDSHQDFIRKIYQELNITNYKDQFSIKNQILSVLK